MIEISNISLELDDALPIREEVLRKVLAKKLGVNPREVLSVQLTRKSVDARKKSHVHLVLSVAASLADERLEQQLLSNNKARVYTPYAPLVVQLVPRPENAPRPLVVGTGPAGLFAALYLARAGLNPLVIEQGPSVEDRANAIETAISEHALYPWANIQFGEGGAGTFSDGKLTTGIKSPWAADVLHWFVEAGAPESILVDAKPHIGTDILREVVKNLREQIAAAGGEVRFETKFINATISNNTLQAAVIQNPDGTTDTIPVQAVILACGHSARDTFELLFDQGVKLEPKPFSIGVRIEHPQAAINQAQYGIAARHPALGAADYKLSVQVPDDTSVDINAQRGVYTFCMCPGGEVVCAASEPHTVVTNGMSYHARAGANANSALLVGVSPEDFGSEHPLAGVAFQRELEQAAYTLAVKHGGAPYQAPAMRVGDFLAEDELAAQAFPDVRRGKGDAYRVEPTYDRGVVWCDIRECLPPFATRALQRALPLLDKKLSGFAHPEAIMTAVETRSSSPVRIVRDSTLQAQSAGGDTLCGLYPCGEGAGYAGGIMSAACDGMRVAAMLCDTLRNESNS